MQRGNYDQALAQLTAGLEVLQVQGARALEASADRYLGLLYRAKGEIQTALECLNRAIALATELGMPLAQECQELCSKLQA